MKSIKNMLPTQAVVIRNGVEKKIQVEELVVGDLIVLSVTLRDPIGSKRCGGIMFVFLVLFCLFSQAEAASIAAGTFWRKSIETGNESKNKLP